MWTLCAVVEFARAAGQTLLCVKNSDRQMCSSNSLLGILQLVLVLACVGTILADETISSDELTLVKAAERLRINAIERVYGSVVAIYDEKRQGGGSAVIFDSRGFALTNHHVVAGAGKTGWGGLADGRHYHWKLIGTDPGGDIAIIKLSGKESFPASPLGDSRSVRVGDWTLAMGNPFLLAEDQRPTVTLGVVSGVKRYQGGAASNMLVYGNCIQVDSSINPGNSGGPLFDLNGEIVGINGRGSFKERGRVNVGLGYAVSSSQIKNFLPDLMATKIAQHGTLDALFDDRGGQVVCETLNLDAPVAKAGLKLGDRLSEFEGVQIKSANEFTNIMSTLPADWPAHLVYQRDGERKDIWVRLFALPYQTNSPTQPPPQPKEKDEDRTPEDDNSKQPPKGRRQQAKGAPRLPIENPGTIRDQKQNLANCRDIIRQWQDEVGFSQLDESVQIIRLTDDVLRGEVRIGQQQVFLARDGRFRINVTESERVKSFGFDGQEYWINEYRDNVSTVSHTKALMNPYFVQVGTLATLLDRRPLERFGKLRLDGGDKAMRRAAYRIKTVDDAGQWFYVWLSVLDELGDLHVQLLRASPHIDGEGRCGAVAYSDWRKFEAIRLPHRRDFTRGLSDRIELSFVTTNCETVDEVDDAIFRKP